MSKVNMYWYKMPRGRKNFGDELGPYIINKLSGKEISYIPIVDKPARVIWLYLKGVLNGKYKLKEIKYFLKSIYASSILVSVGSIIHIYGDSFPTVWGAGIIKRDDNINNANFLAVRGKYTQERLKELNYTVPEAIGDPAILLPLIIKPKVVKKYRLGVIPHYIHFNNVTEIFKESGVLVIDLLEDIEEVISKINSCERTISSSLHGLIVSHAYNIPSLWYKLSSRELSGDNIKFYDYFSSVNIKEYAPFLTLNEMDIGSIINNVDSNPSLNGINLNLNDMQLKLLKAAPFPLKEEYSNMLL